MRRGAAVIVAVGASIALVAGCSSGDGAVESTADVTATPSTSAGSTATAPRTDPLPTATESTTVGTGPETTTAPTTTVLATVPDDGVPGIDSDEPFCRAWSEFAGSFQALSLAASFGEPAAAVRLEVIASSAVSGAAKLLDGSMPTEVADERDAFIDELIGPFSRRAGRAVEALVDAGMGQRDIVELGQLWLAALADAGIDDPDIEVVVPERLAADLDDAVVVFAANVPPIPADPSLITDAQAPATLAYLAGNCPDQGILAGNDVIDG